MKRQTWFFTAMGLITLISLISAWFTFSTRTPDLVQVFPATVNRDCAPWDGAAFTVSILRDGSVIQISIYQSPDLKYPLMFSFPDETLRDGNAFLLLPVGVPEPLRGRIWFESVNQQKPVEGSFDLRSEGGVHVEGAFTAEWENKAVYCG